MHACSGIGNALDSAIALWTHAMWRKKSEKNRYNFLVPPPQAHGTTAEVRMNKKKAMEKRKALLTSMDKRRWFFYFTFAAVCLKNVWEEGFFINKKISLIRKLVLLLGTFLV